MAVALVVLFAALLVRWQGAEPGGPPQQAETPASSGERPVSNGATPLPGRDGRGQGVAEPSRPGESGADTAEPDDDRLEVAVALSQDEATSSLVQLQAYSSGYLAAWGELPRPVGPCPAGSLGEEPVAWSDRCLDAFRALGWEPIGGLSRCAYSIQPVSGNGEAVLIEARCDVDGDGEPAVYRVTSDPGTDFWQETPDAVR